MAFKNADWDCIVVGGGASGLSAALVLGRARRRHWWLTQDGPGRRRHLDGWLSATAIVQSLLAEDFGLPVPPWPSKERPTTKEDADVHA